MSDMTVKPCQPQSPICKRVQTHKFACTKLGHKRSFPGIWLYSFNTAQTWSFVVTTDYTAQTHKSTSTKLGQKGHFEVGGKVIIATFYVMEVMDTSSTSDNSWIKKRNILRRYQNWVPTELLKYQGQPSV